MVYDKWQTPIASGNNAPSGALIYSFISLALRPVHRHRYTKSMSGEATPNGAAGERSMSIGSQTKNIHPRPVTWRTSVNCIDSNLIRRRTRAHCHRAYSGNDQAIIRAQYLKTCGDNPEAVSLLKRCLAYSSSHRPLKFVDDLRFIQTRISNIRATAYLTWAKLIRPTAELAPRVRLLGANLIPIVQYIENMPQGARSIPNLRDDLGKCVFYRKIF